VRRREIDKLKTCGRRKALAPIGPPPPIGFDAQICDMRIGNVADRAAGTLGDDGGDWGSGEEGDASVNDACDTDVFEFLCLESDDGVGRGEGRGGGGNSATLRFEDSPTQQSLLVTRLPVIRMTSSRLPFLSPSSPPSKTPSNYKTLCSTSQAEANVEANGHRTAAGTHMHSHPHGNTMSGAELMNSMKKGMRARAVRSEMLIADCISPDGLMLMRKLSGSHVVF
jgi:hypothetical protein